MECVRIRPFEQVADDKHQARISMIARSGAYARARAQARGRAPAPLPARMAMALAPLPKFLSTILKTRYAFGINSVYVNVVTINQ
jgi:hypothetical protein